MKRRPFTKAGLDKINHRRHILVLKKYDAGLTTDDARELEGLQKKAERYLESFEEPSISTILRQVRELKRDARAAFGAALTEGKRQTNPFRERILALMDKEASGGLTKREKAELARLQKEGVRWTMLEEERNPPTEGEVKQMDRRAKRFAQKLLGRR